MAEAIDRDDFIRRGGFASYFPYVSFGFFFITIPFLSPQISLFGSMTVNETESAAIAFAALLASLVGAALIAHFSDADRKVALRFALGSMAAYAACCFIRGFTALLGAPCVELAYVVDVLCAVLALSPMMYWGLLYKRLPLRQGIVSFGCAFALGGAVNALFASSLFDPHPMAVCFTALAGLLFPCLDVVSSLGRNPGSMPSLPSRQGRFSDDASSLEFERISSENSSLPRAMLLTLNLCLGLLVFVFASSARCAAYDSGAMPHMFKLLEILALPCGGVCAAVFFALRKNVTLSSLMDVFIPVAGAFFLLFSQFAVDTPMFAASFFISHVLMSAIAVMAFGATSFVSSREEFPVFLLFAFVYAGMAAGSLLGLGLYRALGGYGIGSALLFAASAYFVYITLSSLLRTRSLIRAMAQLTEKEHGVCLLDPECHGSFDADGACRIFAAKHGLTPREGEILLLLSSGHTSPYIASQLYISENTVRTHMRNMYRKLGIGSKEQLVQMLEDETRECIR